MPIKGPLLLAGWLGSPCRGREGSLPPEGTQCQGHIPLKHPGGNPSWPSGPVKAAAAVRGHQRDSEPELTGPVIPTSSAPGTPSSSAPGTPSSWVTAALSGVHSSPGLSPASAISLRKAGHRPAQARSPFRF